MRFTHNLPIRAKVLLVAMATCFGALLLTGGALLYFLSVTLHRGFAAELQTLGNMIAQDNSVPLAFRDAEASGKRLAALHAKPQITSACVLDSEGKLFVQYGNENGSLRLADRPANGEVTYNDGYAELVLPVKAITPEDLVLGRLQIRARFKEYHDKLLLSYSLVVGAVILGSLGVMFIFATRLQRMISAPITALTEVVNQITREGNYSRRASTTSGGEVKSLTTAFNELLNQVEAGQERYEVAISGSSVGIWDWDFRSGMIYFSPRWKEILGYADSELPNLFVEWESRVHPDDLKRFQDALQAHLTGTTPVLDLEMRLQHRNGNWRWVHCRGAAVRNGAGDAVRMAGSQTDITTRKEAEAELLEMNTQFLRAQRAASIGSLASGIAHDLNNILSPIISYAHVLRLELKEEEQLVLVSGIQTSAKRGAEVVKQVLSMARGGDERGPVQLKYLMKEVAFIAQNCFPKDISVLKYVPDDLHPVVGDATQLHQVCMNLCINARDAMPQGGNLVLSVENVEVSTPNGGVHGEGRTGPHVCIAVEDTGAGIPAEIISRIFEPHFTTKDPGKGTGLGLWTVLRIVREHHGFIDVSTRAGEGTVFKVYLPATTAPEQAASEPPSLPALGSCRGGVLVVDDEEEVRQATSWVLSRYGFEPFMAANGQEAFELLDEHGETIQAVITDLMMPAMNGVDLSTRIKFLRPGLLIVACTASKQEGLRAQREDSGVDVLLEKPFLVEDLIAVLHQHLRISRPSRRS